MCESETFLNGSRLNLSEPLNRVGSCDITVTFLLSIWRSILRISIPSISIFPPQSSTILERERQIVDLPAPVLPTTPTLVPGLTTKLRFLRTISVLGLYLRLALINSTCPYRGHFFVSTWISASFTSWGISSKAKSRWMQIIFLSISPKLSSP